MKKLAILTVLIAGTTFAQIEKKACFIGNSYTYFNDMPGMVSALANADGNTLIKDQNTPGGHTLNAHSTNTTTLSKISGDTWDFVILQDQSQLPSFPWWQVSEEVLPYAEILVDSIRSANECAIPLFYNTWGRRDGDPMWDSINTFTKMNQRLHHTYDYMADKHSGMLAPVGIGFAHIADDPDSPIDHAALYAPDGSHPSPQGSYLAACLFYEAIFETSAEGNTYVPAEISEDEANYLQGVAHHVFNAVDSVEVNYTHPIADYEVEFDGLTATFTNTSQHAFEYFWEFGDGETSTEEHPVHTYPDDAHYDVTLTAIYCDREDELLDLELFEGFTQNEMTLFTVYPNPSTTGQFTINYHGEAEKVTIRSISGQIISEQTLTKNTTLELPEGVYLISDS